MGGGGGNNAGKAAKAQKESAKIAANEQRYEYNLANFNLGPTRAQGALAQRQLGYELGLPDLGVVGYDPTTGNVGLAGYGVPVDPTAPANQNGTSGGTNFAPSATGPVLVGPFGTGVLGVGTVLPGQNGNNGTATSQPTTNVLPPIAGQAEPGQLTSGFKETPGYQFQLQQGLNAIQGSAASKGLLHSGATLKALNNYAQGQANQEYGDYYNRLAAMAGYGQTATNSINQQGQAVGNNISDLQTQVGNARASAYLGNNNSGGLLNAGMGALGGAKLGSFLGPVGTVAGGALGFLGGLFG